jgi:hypothetical protein
MARRFERKAWQALSLSLMHGRLNVVKVSLRPALSAHLYFKCRYPALCGSELPLSVSQLCGQRVQCQGVF